VVDVLSWLSQYGAWGLLLIAVILFAIFYDKLEKPIARLHDLFSWAGASFRRRAIRSDIQSKVNWFSQAVDKEVPNIMPYNMKLSFVSEVDRAELLREKNLVLVRIHDRRHDDKNFVHAILTFCPIGVLPASRPYLDASLSDAIDFTIARKFLNAIRYQSALNYLHKEVIEPTIAEKPELDKLCRILDRLDEQGLFTKVVLRELRDFGAKVGSRYPTEAHKKETKQLVEYMDAIATRTPGELMEQAGCQGAYISMGFVFVGTHEKIATEGATRYLHYIQKLKTMKLERAYIAARDQYIQMAERVSYLAEKGGVGKRLKPKRYYAVDNLGQQREHILIEMRLIPSAPFAPPEQGRLLEE